MIPVKEALIGTIILILVININLISVLAMLPTILFVQILFGLMSLNVILTVPPKLPPLLLPFR